MYLARVVPLVLGNGVGNDEVLVGLGMVGNLDFGLELSSGNGESRIVDSGSAVLLNVNTDAKSSCLWKEELSGLLYAILNKEFEHAVYTLK